MTRLGLTRLSLAGPAAIDTQDALDDNAHSFSLFGDADWFGQDGTTNDGQDALESGGIGSNEKSCFDNERKWTCRCKLSLEGFFQQG